MKTLSCELLTLCLIGLLFGSMAYAIITTAEQSYIPKPTKTSTPMYPDIPKCDKELWLRIKDGCNDEDT